MYCVELCTLAAVNSDTPDLRNRYLKMAYLSIVGHLPGICRISQSFSALVTLITHRLDTNGIAIDLGPREGIHSYFRSEAA